MRLSLSKWLRPANASTAELEQQLEQAEQQCREAQVAKEAAQEAFDVSGATSAENALLEAEDVGRRANVHFARAKRLLQAARERDEAEHKRQLEAEAQALEAELTQLRSRARSGPEVGAEVEALLRVVEARQERWRLTHRIRERARRLETVRLQLGHEPKAPTMHDPDEPGAVPVREALESLLRQLGSDPRRDLVRPLVPEHDAYRLGATASELESLPPLPKVAQ